MSKNSENTDFQNNSKGLTSAPTISISRAATTQFLYPAASPDGASFPRCFYIKAAGSFDFKDASGNSDSYPVLASQQLILENVTEVEATTDVTFSEQY